VILAGVRPDLLDGIRRLRFTDWFPSDRIFVEEGDDADSATLLAVRRAYALLGPDNHCQHCAARVHSSREAPGAAYYLV